MRRFDVTVAGELNLDLILYGLPEELPGDRELLASGMMLTLGSSSAIVAHNLAALGNQVGFVSRIGDDQLGQIALDRLAVGGVDVSKVRRVTGATKTGLTVILQRDGWRYVDVLLPNEREARRIAHNDDLNTAITSLAEMVPVVVVKLGERGAMAQRGAERFVSPPVKVDLVDAVGAGDSFDAGFLHQYLRGADLETCLANGNLAGALSTTR